MKSPKPAPLALPACTRSALTLERPSKHTKDTMTSSAMMMWSGKKYAAVMMTWSGMVLATSADFCGEESEQIYPLRIKCV